MAAARRSGACAPAFVAGHSLGEYSAHVAAGTLAFGDAAATGAQPRALHAGGRAGGRRAPWPRFWASTRRRRAGVPGGAARRGGESREPERARPGCDCRQRPPRWRAAGERAKALGAKRVIPLQVERALPLRADEAGRGAAGAGTRVRSRARPARAGGGQRRRRAEARRARRRIEALVAQVSARCAGRTSCGGLRPRASPRMLRWARARC